jgi:hypothetical protein
VSIRPCRIRDPTASSPQVAVPAPGRAFTAPATAHAGCASAAAAARIAPYRSRKALGRPRRRRSPPSTLAPRQAPGPLDVGHPASVAVSQMTFNTRCSASVCPSVRPSVRPSARPPARPPACLPVCLSVCLLSVHVPVCLSVCLSVNFGVRCGAQMLPFPLVPFARLAVLQTEVAQRMWSVPTTPGCIDLGLATSVLGIVVSADYFLRRAP